ncbi:restriction endonuclease [Burkholderia sp. BCC1640]|uniref:restriction endonuclease n=1 Tax=Burkholderia sp. BCC1640 TaxID=2676294 RepID=UPI00158A5D26|nr:restriction endonuclease [Burkholderia sp. BCC1640]
MRKKKAKHAGRAMNAKDWLDLEHLVANIQRSLAPAAKVEHNVKVKGRNSEVDRQVDVLVTQNIGQYTMTIAIDCKDYKKPIDVKGVEEFAGMVSDIGANKGVLVCPAGFTETAKTVAKKLQMELYRPIDTGDHKWRARPTIPAVCEYVSTTMAFQITCSAPKPLRLPYNLAHIEAFDENGVSLGTALECALRRWNNAEYPTTTGRHDGLTISANGPVQVDNGYGERVPVDFTVYLDVKIERYFGQLKIERLSGFLDEQTGLTHANSFSIGVIEPEEVEAHWMKLDDEQAPPIRPVLTLRGLIGWEA